MALRGAHNELLVEAGPRNSTELTLFPFSLATENRVGELHALSFEVVFVGMMFPCLTYQN